MRSRRSSFSSNPLFNLRQLFARGWRRRVLCLVLIFGLLIIPDAGYAVRAATGVAVKAVKNSVEPIPVAVHYFKRLFRRAARPRPQETTVDRSARVASIQITPAKIVGYQNQQLPFTAIGRDANGDIAQGARFAWSSSDTDKLQIDNAGMATLLNPGLVWVTAATANASARVPVLIRAGNRPQQSDSEFQNDQDQLHPDGTTATSGVGRLLDSLSESLLPTAHAQTNGGDSGDFGYDELWNDPRNLAGMPRNRVMSSTAIGAVLPEGSDFEFSVPIWGLPGRGLPLGVAMNYNSRIWSRHGSAVTFNAINSWPFLGFTLGFGRIVTYASGSNTKFVLIDSDGTRHYLGSGPAGTTQTYQTNDGSHITYVGNATTGGTLYYNSGLQKTVALGNNRLLVTGIADTNGNYLSIAYAWQSAPCQDNSGKVGYVWTQALSSMTDTLGRVISFNYDCFNYLTSITAPGQNGSSTTIAQFDYALTYPSTSFSGLTVENVPSGKPVPTLSHVYNPTTQTGYKLTYSAYGMISKVSLRKQMSYDSNTGVISDGTEKAYVSFNYPASASSLTDAPSFSQWTQSPAATTGGTATWSFTSSSGSGTKAFTLTNPDSSTLTLTRSDNTSAADYGLLTQSEVKTSGGTSMAKAVISYANDSGGQPQVANVVSYDELSQPTNETKVDFDYDSYGNVTNLRDYGHQQSGSWVVRRRTHNVYKTDTSYVNAYLRSLVIESDTYDAQLDTNDANDVLVAKSTFTFDDYSALGGMENYGGNYSGGSAPPGYNTAYNDTTKTVRGNLTGRTAYYDITGNLSYTWLRKVDIFGNVTKEELSCCNIQTITYSGGNDFALAEQVTKGPSGGPQVTMSTSYTFNTSATSTTTDPNSQTTTVTSRDDLLRPTLVTYPTSATMSKSYNDNTPSVTQTVSYSEGQTQQSLSATTTYDDWGRVIQQTNGQGGQVNTEYDQMGRVARVSNPFSVGGSPSYWTSYSYDALGRTTTVTLPDNQTVVSSYSGDTVTVTDQVGRQMQRVSDGLGRLVTVNEQDSSGNLSQATNYTYDVLNNLTQVNQGGQLRSYKYDALSRLLYENIPEQSATINDGSGTYWTSKYTYTSFNAVATKQDARGVVTSYSYDSLNRVSQVSYNTVSGVTSAPTVSYTYDSDSTYNTTASGKLLRVNVGSDYQERYTFDSAYRIASMIRTIGSRSYTSSYGYNQASQLTQLTYPSSRAINVTHDSSGRLSGLNEGGNGPTWLSSVSYDIAGQVTGDTLGNGITEQFGYDAARMQMTSQKAGTASPYTNRMDLTYSYNATSSGQFGAGTTSGNPGQLLSLSGTLNQTTESASYTYDNVGRLVTSSQTSNSTSAQRRFDYDRFGNRTNVWDATSGGNPLQTISLDTPNSVPSNRLQIARSQATNVASASNGATASASSTYSSSATPASGAIDGDHKGSNWGSGGGWMDNTASTYPDWLQVNFTASKTINEVDVYSIQDNYSSPSEPTEQMTFSSYGLTAFQVQYWDGSAWQTVSGGSISGNNKVWRKLSFASVTTDRIRVYVTGAADGISRLAEVEAYGYGYDAAGNVINDGMHTYAYDGENRLVSVDGGATASYAYDQQNRRYKKTVGSAVTHYVWQGSQVLSEHNGGTGAVLVDYITSGGRMLAKVASGTASYFLSDHLSARLSLDASGNVVGRQAHLPFGEDFAENGSQQKQHFTSYERDNESGSDYAMNRQYNQSVGRFLSADRYSASGYMVDPQSWNRYAYTQSDPINFTDNGGTFREGAIPPWEIDLGMPTPPPVRPPTKPIWHVDPGERGGSGGGDQRKGKAKFDKDYNTQAVNAINGLKSGCKEFLGPQGLLDMMIHQLQDGEITIISRYGTHGNDPIPHANGLTFQQWMDRAGDDWSGVNAVTVNIHGHSAPYDSIIIGAVFDDPHPYQDIFLYDYVKGDKDLFQALTLVHEVEHVMNDKNDDDLAALWTALGGKLDSSVYDPSDRISKFLADDCPH